MDATVNVYEAKTQLSRLLERVDRGERITIARAGKPVADLVPHRRPGVVFGQLKGAITIDDEHFDDPDADIAALFYGK